MKEIPNLNGQRSLAGRFFGWLFNPRILRRILIVFAALVTLIAAYYARANWRGKRLWEEAKHEMAAKGEVWDWSAYVPAPVPDDQNIFKAPKMAEWFSDSRSMLDVPLEQRVTNDFARRFFNPVSIQEINSKPDAASYLAWSDQFQGDFETISAALKRPYARIVADYSKTGSITLPNVASLYAVVKTLTQSAKCHLILGQPDKAWQELTLLHDLRRMVEGQGKFITTEGDWMRRELARHSLQVIAKGTELHAWQEPQLVAIQQQLRDTDILALHAEALKCGCALLTSSLVDGDFSKALLIFGNGGFWTRFKRHPEYLLFRIAPRGIIYETAAKQSRNWWNMINAITPADGIIRPGDVSQAFASWKKAREGLPALLRTQTLVNEGQVACALERYRLGHGTYPEALDTLVPRCIEKLPQDLISGKPLIYHRTDDGSFLLYSVGWNETDDGGNVVIDKDLLVNLTEGDWVWKSCMY